MLNNNIIRNKVKSLIIGLCVFSTSTAFAQNVESGYFTDGFLYRHDMNPAIGNTQNYVSMPAFGNFSIEHRGNVGLKNFLYTVNGKTVTYLNPDVSTAEALKNIKDNMKTGLDQRMQILGIGFKGMGGYNTIEINERAEMNIGVPGSLFKAAKEGLTNETYDFSNFSSRASGAVELALGHSHQVNKQLRVGAKLKFIVPIMRSDLKVTTADLTLGQDNYTATVDATLTANVKDLTFSHAVNENTNHTYVDGVDDMSVGPIGFGLGVDLGAEYAIDDNFKVSASLLDLGFISYGKTFTASTNGLKTVTTDGRVFNTDDNEPNNFSDEMNKLKDDLSALYELNDNGETGGSTKALGATMNIGGQYALPSYKKLTFGLLNTTRIQGRYSWTDFRLSTNIAPAKFFSAGVNLSAGTYGAGFGWIINLHPNGFNLFLAMDHTLGTLSKQGVPLNGNSTVSMGINFPFN